MYKHKRISISLLILFLALVFNGCSMLSVNEKIENQGNKVKAEASNKINKDVINKNIDANDNQIIKDTVLKFETALRKGDSKAIKGLVDKEGIYSITYFVDKRDRNVVVHLYKQEIRDDLVLANSEKMGITLDAMFSPDVTKSSIQNMHIHSSKTLSDISFNVDWHKNNERVIENKLGDIVKTCEKIILTNNEDIPQVFKIKDNFIVFTESSVTQEPNIECTGDWVIFEKIGKEYKLRAVMEFE